MSKAKEDMKMKVDFDGLRKQATQNANALHRAIDELNSFQRSAWERGRMSDGFYLAVKLIFVGTYIVSLMAIIYG